MTSLSAPMIDPKDLTAAERKALSACAVRGLTRCKHGFKVAGQPGVIKLATMDSIIARNLAQPSKFSNGTPYPTWLGRLVVKEMSERGMR